MGCDSVFLFMRYLATLPSCVVLFFMLRCVVRGFFGVIVWVGRCWSATVLLCGGLSRYVW